MSLDTPPIVYQVKIESVKIENIENKLKIMLDMFGQFLYLLIAIEKNLN